MMITMLRSLLAATMTCAITARAREATPTQGCLQTTIEGKVIELPLKHTRVDAEVSGFLSRVRVTQVFANPYDTPIEAIYVFPLPQDAAVNDMQITIGDRVIRGQIKKRAEAREIYDQAKRAGKTAALLDQERPNIFSQAVANILPGSEIEVQITYDEVLRYSKGRYEFVFPMVVGPRFIPPGSDPDDAQRISPPVLKPGERNGHDIALTLTLHAGLPVTDIASPTHEVAVEGDGSKRVVTLSPRDAIPNKDFVLRYRVGADAPTFASLTHKEGDKGYLLLMFQPPDEPTPDVITPKEMVFVVDCSGSMNGEPIALAKQAMRHALKNLGTNDTFQIIRFSESASPFADEPLLATPENIRRGLSYVNNLEGEGGTMMIEGVKAALDYPLRDDRLRIVCFMTDGYIGNDAEILEAIDARLGDSTRLFSFGVGSSVNRYLLDSMAAVGRGHVQYITLGERPDEQVNAFYERVRSPVLTHLRIDWGSLDVNDISPGRLRDLFAGEPLFLIARYAKAGSDTIRILGKINGRDVSYPLQVALPDAEPANATLSGLWARSRIKELELEFDGYRDSGKKEAAITGLALEHRLMSQYTSFVAVEDKIVNEGGKLTTIQVPVEMPEGVSHDAVFGDDRQRIPGVGMAAPMALPMRTLNAGGGFVAESRRLPESVRYTNSLPAEEKEATNVSLVSLEWVTIDDEGRSVVLVSESGDVRLLRYDAAGALVSNMQLTRLTLDKLRQLADKLRIAIRQPLHDIKGDAGLMTAVLLVDGVKTQTTRTLSPSGTTDAGWNEILDLLKRSSGALEL